MIDCGFRVDVSVRVEFMESMYSCWLFESWQTIKVAKVWGKEIQMYGAEEILHW